MKDERSRIMSFPGRSSSVLHPSSFLFNQLPAVGGLGEFGADAIEAEGAQLKLLAQPAEDGGLVAVGVVLERAGNEVGALALGGVVDEAVLRQERFQLPQPVRVK